MSEDQPITSRPGLMGGRRVFRGSRVPVEVLFENLEDGMTVDEIPADYETLNRADVMAMLEMRDRALAILNLSPDVLPDSGDELPAAQTEHDVTVHRGFRIARDAQARHRLVHEDNPEPLDQALHGNRAAGPTSRRAQL